MGTETGAFEIGTEEWLAQTGGRLTMPQALVLSVQGFAQSAREGMSRHRPDCDEASRQSARVAVARKELMPVRDSLRDRVVERQGHGLLNHACRTYVLGAALLSDDVFRRVNHTAAAVAALAHDDGLLHPSPGDNCFTADSAVEANVMSAQRGAPRSSADVARAAVISHFQPKLPAQAGADAHLVALGASADVMGFGLKKLDPALMNEIWQEWPDENFLADVKELLKGEQSRAPRTRPGVLARSGMPYLLRASR
jgi:hypothetical protein